MALINRINRLFRADMHAVLDRLEEPDALLKQAVREMEESISDRQRHLKQLKHQHLQLQDRQREFEHILKQIKQELDICFDSDNESLARNLIKRRLETERFSRFLKRKQDKLETSINDIKQSLDDHRDRLASVKQKQELLCEEQRPASSEEYNFPETVTISEDDIEVAFLREKQQRAST
jgi:phage shock protein A